MKNEMNRRTRVRLSIRMSMEMSMDMELGRTEPETFSGVTYNCMRMDGYYCMYACVYVLYVLD
jgi:hypothetical protein